MKSLGLGCLFVVIITSLAFGSVPTRMEYQGYLTDAVGTPIDCQDCSNPYTFQFSLYDAVVGGELLWTETHPGQDVANGIFRVELGIYENLDAEMLIGDRWLEIAINGQAPLTPRQSVISVPYALRAGVADHAIESENAVSLGGLPVESFVQTGDTGLVTETELQELLDSLGYVAGDNDTLTSLICAIDQIAKWTGTAWACQDDVDTDTDTDTHLSETEVDAFVANNGYAMDASLAALAKTGDWADLQNVPAELADGDDDTDTLASLTCAIDQIAKWNGTVWACQDDVDTDTDTHLSETAVDAYVANNGYAMDATLAALAQTGDWADLQNVPAELADGDDDTDTLASLSCTINQIAKWNGTAWACQDDVDTDTDTDTHLSETAVEDFITNAPINLASDTTLNGLTISTGTHTTALGWTDITGIPAGFADNTDDNSQLSESQVENYITNSPIALAGGSTIGGSSPLTNSTLPGRIYQRSQEFNSGWGSVFTVSCDSGDLALGGGCYSSSHFEHSSWPSGSAWHCGYPCCIYYITAYVICLDAN